MLMGRLVSPRTGREPAPPACPVPPEGSPKAQASLMPGSGGVSYGGWYFAPPTPK